MVKAAKTSDIANFATKKVTISGQDILLINVKGTFYAVENECPHQGAPMTTGIIKDEQIACPRHGYSFSLKDGVCQEHPEFILKTYRVELSGDDILVDVE